MTKFAGIVSYPARIEAEGKPQQVAITCWLGLEAGDIPAHKFDILQNKYKGSLEVVQKTDGIEIIRKIEVCTSRGAQQEAEVLGRAIRSNLDVLVQTQANGRCVGGVRTSNHA